MLEVNTPRAYVSDLSPDAAYAATAFSGTCTYLSTTVIQDLSKSFTDAVLGEQVAFLTGTNAPTWRRVIARTATQLTLDAAVGSTAASSTYIVGKTKGADPEKVLQLGRNFNSGNRRVEVYPQKSAVSFISLH